MSRYIINKFIKHLFLSLIILISSAFRDIKISDTTTFRESSYFAGSANLIGKGTLHKGQTASVLAIDTNKKFGVGVKVKIKSGANAGKIGWIYFHKKRNNRTFHFYRNKNGHKKKIVIKNNFKNNALAKVVKDASYKNSILSANMVKIHKKTRYYVGRNNKKVFWNNLTKGTYRINTYLLRQLINEKKYTGNMVPIIVPTCINITDGRPSTHKNCQIWIKGDAVQLLNATNRASASMMSPQELYKNCNKFYPVKTTPTPPSVRKTINKKEVRSDIPKQNWKKKGNSLEISGIKRIMKTSHKGIDFIKELEGFRSYLYQDRKKKAIGYGHNVTSKAELKEYKYGITKGLAKKILKKDLQIFERVVNKYIKVPLTQGQFDALVSMAFNIGASAFANRATFVKKINNQSSPSVIKHWWSLWKKSSKFNVLTQKYEKKDDPILVERRKKEWLMYNQ